MQIKEAQVEVKADIPLGGLEVHEIRVRLTADVSVNDYQREISVLYDEAYKALSEQRRRFLSWKNGD